MTQERYINFGHPADATGIKAINQQFFAPGVLRSDEPLLRAVAPDQILINPHSVVFGDGVVLRETEILYVDVTTQPASANYTIYYVHVDEDIVGGTVAELHVDSALKESVEDGVILGWVVYPGGSVPVDDTMVIPNWFSQVKPGHQYKEVVRLPNTSMTIVKSPAANVSETLPVVMLSQTIPGTPHQITLVPGVLASSLLAANISRFRVFSQDDGSDMTRVTGTPAGTGEYHVNTATGVVTFHSTDEGKVVDISDFTYGPASRWTDNDSSTLSGVVDEVYEFETCDVPFRSIFVEYVILKSGFTIDPVEIFDANGESISWLMSKDEPSTPDGTVSRVKIRLLGAITYGTEGQHLLVRLRKSLAESSEGLILKVRASAYDLPF